jgi:hypothetical protein
MAGVYARVAAFQKKRYDAAMRRIGLCAALLLSSAAYARGTCVVEGRAVTPFVVEVAPKEASPFKLRVAGVAASVTPGGLGQPAAVHVKGPLAFDGRADAADVPARTRRVTEALNGLLRLAPATERITLHANVRARVVDAEVRLPGVELRGLTLPCDALTLDAVNEPDVRPGDDGGGARFVAAGRQLHFRGGPNSGPAMEAIVDDSDELELRQTETSGEWARVTTRWADGTTLAGWVRRDELKAAGVHHDRIGDPLPAPNGCAREPAAHANQRIATVAVAAGTLVYAARYLGPWAKIVDGKKLAVRFSAKDDWVEVVQAPGVASVDECPNAVALEQGWIPRAAAQLPAEPAPAATDDAARHSDAR